MKFLSILFIVALTFSHQAFSMSIGKTINEKETAHLEFTDVTARILDSLDRKLNAGNNDPIAIRLIMRIILQRVLELEKEKEEP